MVIGMVSVKYLSTSVTILQQVLVLCAASLLYKCSTSCMNSFFQVKHKICLSLSMFGTKLKKNPVAFNKISRVYRYQHNVCIEEKILS